MVFALVIFGPRKLPEIGRSMGKALSEFRRASLSGMESLRGAVEESREEGKKDSGRAVPDDIRR